MKREPAVAGQFYPASSIELSKQIDDCTDECQTKESVIGLVSPHAGIMYSGMVTGAVFSRIIFPQTLILIGPNHTGLGSPVSIMSSGQWVLPTGIVPVDDVLAQKLKAQSDIIEENNLAHQMEHSLEVQLPFALHFNPGIKIVPLTIMGGTYETCVEIGEALAAAIKETEYPVTIVASSDMSHYISDATAREKDKMAIERVLALDPEGLYDIVSRENISMCGVMPVTAMLYAACSLAAKEVELVKYMTSGETSGDFDYVVGYAGLIIK